MASLLLKTIESIIEEMIDKLDDKSLYIRSNHGGVEIIDRHYIFLSQPTTIIIVEVDGPFSEDYVQIHSFVSPGMASEMSIIHKHDCDLANKIIATVTQLIHVYHEHHAKSVRG